MLHWDPDQYEDIKEIMLPHDVIWMPVNHIFDEFVAQVVLMIRYDRIWQLKSGNSLSFYVSQKQGNDRILNPTE